MSKSSSSNGLMTKVWGPPGWLFLHCVSFGYPTDPINFDIEKKQVIGTTVQMYRSFFENLGWVFPCVYCRDSYKQFIKDLPLTDQVLSSRDNLVEWFWKIHSKVNNKLQVKYKNINLDNVKCKYERFRANCTPGKQTGCTIPLTGGKLRATVLIYPDLCMTTFIWLVLCIAILIYLLWFYSK